MAKIMNKRYLASHEPSSKQPCLCGSGKKFKSCCRELYETDAKNDAVLKFNDGNYKEALKACRLEITWYILCHRAHTIPFLESDSKEAENILKSDIGALASLVDLLFNCYEVTGKHKDFPNALNSLTNAIADQRWYDRITYQQALWVLCDSNDNKLAFHELNKIENIHSVDDCDILSLYLDIYPHELSFSKRIGIIDQILSTNPQVDISLHYNTLKGIHYFLITDKEKGIELITNSIDDFKKSDMKKTSYGNFRLAQALELLGALKDDNTLIEDAQDCYQRELDSNIYTSDGTAMLHRRLADSFYACGNYGESIKHYESSLKENNDELTKIFYARALMHANALDSAETVLVGVITDNFDEAEQYDYAVSWAYLALNSKKEDYLLESKKLLTALRPSMPYFINIRDTLLLGLSEIDKKDSKGIISKISKLLRRYIILQPNFFGIGMNLNNVIEDSTEKKRRKKDL